MHNKTLVSVLKKITTYFMPVSVNSSVKSACKEFCLLIQFALYAIR